jgi:hypothetical protein
MRALLFALVPLAAGAACAASTPAPVTSVPPPAEAPVPVATAEAIAAPPSPAPSPPQESAGQPAPLLAVTPAPVASTAAEVGAPEPASAACNDQAPQDFLVRGHFLKEGPDGNARAIQYRTDQYGRFSGFGRPGPDAQPPSTFVVTTAFMGLPVKMHRKVVPALACVEQEIKNTCAAHPYTPHALAGIRYKNTYRGGEVTNHAYGIAIDIDPAINTCCGCVKPWNDAPACKRTAKTEYDRMAMPECWVHAFERFGFYWLGHDVLRDTMHFEFLGDPDRISKDAPAPVEPAPPALSSGAR